MEIALLILSIILIALALLQSNKASDAGQIIAGASERLYGQVKERGLELVLTRVTLFLGLAFFAISLTLFFMA